MNIKWIAFLTIIIGGFLLYKQAIDYDFSKRANLLEHVKIVKSAINADRILGLKGDDSDYTNNDYLRLKEQLTEIGDVVENARYVYIMAKKDNNTVLMVDTQPKKYGTDGLATPGEIYDEFDNDVEELLDESGDRTTEAYTDKWGTFISGLSSITNREDGRVIALVGVDIEVKTWQIGLWKSLISRFIILILAIVLEMLIYFFQKKNIKNASRLAYLATVLESSSDAIYSVDFENKILSWNNGAQNLYGYTANEAINNKATDLIVPVEQWSLMKSDFDKLKQGEILDHQERIRKNKKGELLTLSITMSSVTDRKGKIISISMIDRDISKQKRQELELKNYTIELEKINKLMVGRELRMIELKKKIKKI